MNSEEEKRFRELLRKEDGPLNTYPFDPKTSSVQPSTEHPQTPVPYAGGTSSGRGNDPSRSSGARMPPPVVGLQLPEPGQLGGSNTPQSSIKQLGPAISQQPGQVIPAVSNPYQIPKELQKKPGPEYTGRDAINPFLNGEFGAYKPSGCGNVDNPPLHPRTASGKNANPGPGDVSDSGIGQQVKTPIVTQERSWTDLSKSSAFASPLVQPLPASHLHGATIPQQPIPTPQSQVTRYPGDFNVNQPLLPKSDAADSSGVLKPEEFPQGFLDAGTRKQRIRSQVVESNGGA